MPKNIKLSYHNYIRIPPFFIHYITPFTIWGLILEIINWLSFISIIANFRTSLWANQVNQMIFWPVFGVATCFAFLSLIIDARRITIRPVPAILIFLILVPIIILIIEPFLYYAEVLQLVAEDFPKVIINSEKYWQSVLDVKLLVFTVLPSTMIISNYLKNRYLREIGINNEVFYEIDTEVVFPPIWMLFIISTIWVFIYNFKNDP